jgi:hypothetical protein
MRVADYKGHEPEFQAFLDKIATESGEFLSHFTVPFFDELNGDQAQGGTGVLVQVGEWHFILSAAHVLDVHSRDKSPIYVMGSERGARLISLDGAELFTSYMPAGGKRNIDDPMDSGFLALTPEIVSQLLPSKTFLPLTKIDINDSWNAQNVYLTLGCPCELNRTDYTTREHTLTHFASLSTLYCGERGEPNGFRQGFDLLVHYDPTDMIEPGQNKLALLPKPYGISGCGVWRIAARDESIEHWTPETIRLIGIQHSWQVDVSCLRGVSIIHPLRMLLASLPKLEPHFRTCGLM